jgi:hypothetical protein
VLLAASTLLAGNAQAERRVALVIGNSSYANVRGLANPANDARAVAALLKSVGFDEVDMHLDMNGRDMRRVLRDFSDKAHGAEVALVYYAGHGIEVDGTNYLLPTNAVLERDLDVEDEAVSLDRILKVMEPATRLRLVILDACRDNPFIRTMRKTSATRSIGRGLARVEPPSSDTLVAFSAKAGSVALDGTGMHSPFTAALLQHIASPGLDLRIAFGRVRDTVLKTTANKQEPFVYGSLGGQTVALVPPMSEPRPAIVAAPAAPAPAIDPNAVARRDYEYAAQVGTKEAWNSFLAIHGSGFYSDLARVQRDRTTGEEARTSNAPAPSVSVVAAPSPAVPDVVAPAPSASTVVALAPSASQPDTDTPKPDESETVRLMHAELKRLGCYAGTPGNVWSGTSRRALERFNKHAGEDLDVRVASLGALDVVRSKTTRVCPLECDRGFQPKGDACVRIACRRGYVVGPDGTCEKPQKQPRSASRPEPSRATPERRPAAPAAEKPARGASGASGQRVVCGVTGCRDVPPGCRGEVRPSGNDNVAIVICGGR